MREATHIASPEYPCGYIEIEPILRYFDYTHLPEDLRSRSKPFCDLAHHIIATTPRNPERSVALRKLLEAKDAAVRAGL